MGNSSSTPSELKIAVASGDLEKTKSLLANPATRRQMLNDKDNLVDCLLSVDDVVSDDARDTKGVSYDKNLEQKTNIIRQCNTLQYALLKFNATSSGTLIPVVLALLQAGVDREYRTTDKEGSNSFGSLTTLHIAVLLLSRAESIICLGKTTGLSLFKALLQFLRVAKKRNKDIENSNNNNNDNNIGGSAFFVDIENSLSDEEKKMRDEAPDFDINAKTIGGACPGQTPLHMLCRARVSGSADLHNILIELLANGARVNERDSHQRTPLHYCCISRVSPTSILAELLATDGIDVNAQDSRGFTALHYAVLFLQREKISLLLSHHKIDCSLKTYVIDGESIFDSGDYLNKIKIADKILDEIPADNVSKYKRAVKELEPFVQLKYINVSTTGLPRFAHKNALQFCVDKIGVPPNRSSNNDQDETNEQEFIRDCKGGWLWGNLMMSEPDISGCHPKYTGGRYTYTGEGQTEVLFHGRTELLFHGRTELLFKQDLAEVVKLLKSRSNM